MFDVGSIKHQTSNIQHRAPHTQQQKKTLSIKFADRNGKSGVFNNVSLKTFTKL